MFKPDNSGRTLGRFAVIALLIQLAAPLLPAFTLVVRDQNGVLVSGFRWMVQEDNTYAPVLGAPSTDTLAVNIHRTYAPVAESGLSVTSSASVNVPNNKRYIVSVLPFADHTLSGGQVAVGQGSVTVTVNTQPVRTGQISVLVFHDNRMINGAPDIPAEGGLAGFSILVFDAGGRMLTDTFGNPLGTEYQRDINGDPILDPDGAPIVETLGTGNIITGPTGEVFIKYLAPGKYGVRAVPPLGTDWEQTATIEGTVGIDAWPIAGEPPYFAEGGMASWHAFIGFIHPQSFAAGSGTGTITGQAVYAHDPKPPMTPAPHPGPPVPEAWIGLNSIDLGDLQVYAQPADPETGAFTVSGVPAGNYIMTIWDRPLDAIIDFRTITIAEGQTIDVGQVPVWGWFGTFKGSVFNDLDQDGFRDPGEPGILEQNVNIRHADGSVFAAQPTDIAGEYGFSEVFPFFHFLIVEVDFAKYKATGATFYVDDGGPVPPGMEYTPQPQADVNPNTLDNLSRTETGTVLTQAMMLFGGQTNSVDWGKANYGAGEGGGLSGVVYYDTTRAENDPRYNGPEPWQPGIPNVQINLYQDSNMDGVIDDVNSDGGVTLADVDNYPFGWQDGSAPRGTEDVDRNNDNAFNGGDAIAVTHTDSWNDNFPTGCPGPVQTVHGVTLPECVETNRTWNQLRPGVFDGGYAFMNHTPGGIDSGNPEVPTLPKGFYIVEATPPKGFIIVKEEDKNVDFGDPPIPELPPPACLGDPHVVPPELTLFPGVETYYAGQTRPLCDRKQAVVRTNQNAAADFYVFTEVPIAGRGWGVVLNDTLLEFNPASPNMANNFGVPYLPISLKDFNGNEVVRVYTDEWGHYDVLVPSTYTANVPAPSGMSPGMFNICLNDPGPIRDPLNPGQFITDPWYHPGYSQVCVVRDFWPGKTTYCDTPILPIAAMGQGRMHLDCEFPDGTPTVKQVDGPTGGPLVINAGDLVTITSLGTVAIPNPDYDPNTPGSPVTVNRDYGFGGIQGAVTVGGTPLDIVAWMADGLTVTAEVPLGLTTGELEVVRGDNGRRSTMGLTLHVGDTDVVRILPGQSIQAAIDTASPGRLILVAPGVYKQNPIVWKKVKLQGYGPFSTIIEAGPRTPEEIAAWESKMLSLETAGSIDLVPGERADFFLEQGAGFTVVANDGDFTALDPARIDGFLIRYATQGGGIFVNAFAHHLVISNNRLESNQGSFGGGIRVGTPSIVNDTLTGFNGSFNDGLRILHNHLNQNGAIDGGGGLALFNGSDGYEVRDNYICGNYSFLYGGGIAHFGLSPNGRIERNVVLNNESFDEGGGIIVAGELVPAGAPAGTLTPGAGSVIINANFIQGNLGGDDGGGIRTLMVNGADVQANPSNPSLWHRVAVLNNMIINNVSADMGAGLALDDTALIYVVNNTVSHNDSTSTGPDSFVATCVPDLPAGQWCPPEAGGGGFNQSIPQAAGIGSRVHSLGLQGAFGPGFEQTYSNPILHDNILWQNRSFYWDPDYNAGWGGLRPDVLGLGGPAEPPVYWDLTVVGTPAPAQLSPYYSVLTDAAGFDASNLQADPLHALPYANEFQATAKGAALGNFVTVAFTPLGRRGDYHLAAASPAIDLGAGIFLGAFPMELSTDVDFDVAPSQPRGGDPDAGADEYTTGFALADVAVTVGAAPSPAFVGQPLTYTVSVSNAGPSGATGVTAVDYLAAGLTFVSATPSQGSCSGTSTVTCSLGAIAPGAGATISIVVVPTAPGSVNNQASVSAAQLDTYLVDNQFAVTTQVTVGALAAPENMRATGGGTEAAGSVTFVWDPPVSLGDGCVDVRYDLLRSVSPGDFTGATCVATDIAAASATDSAIAAPGQVFYYLVRAENACGQNMGTDSTGNPRVGSTCP